MPLSICSLYETDRNGVKGKQIPHNVHSIWQSFRNTEEWKGEHAVRQKVTSSIPSERIWCRNWSFTLWDLHVGRVANKYDILTEDSKNKKKSLSIQNR